MVNLLERITVNVRFAFHGHKCCGLKNIQMRVDAALNKTVLNYSTVACITWLEYTASIEFYILQLFNPYIW